MRSDLAGVWEWFGGTQCRGYSPIYEQVCRAVAGSTEVLDLIDQARPESHLPNVLLAAVHYLLLAGIADPLADVYAGRSTEDPGPLFVDMCLRHEGTILELLNTRHTNTNEVGRSAVLGPALGAVSTRLPGPIALVDVGCSAGLNLLCDRYRLDYGPLGATGPADAEVRLECEVLAGSPPIRTGLPEIEARVGLDREPVDLEDDDALRWQLALVWPDTGRLERTRLALNAARTADLRLIRGDAVEDLPAVIDGLPGSSTPVVVTTWALAYLSPANREMFCRVLTELGRKRPLAWISGEGRGVVDFFSGAPTMGEDVQPEPSILGLVVFDESGPHPELLGLTHPHGRWIDWRAHS